MTNDDGGRAGPGLRSNPDFVRLWTGEAVSSLGSSIATLAYPLLALSVTRSAGQAGLLGLVALTAAALTRLPAGALVDRVPLRRVMVTADLVRLVTTAGLAASVATGHLTLGQLVVGAGVTGAAGSVGDIAHSVAVRHLVPQAQLPWAFAVNEGRGQAIGLVGQPVGGLLYGVAHVLPLVADLVSYAVSTVLSASISRPMLPSTDAGTRPRIRTDLLTGLRFLRREPLLRTTLVAAAAYQLLFAATTFAVIADLTDAGATAGSLGAMFALSAVGGILGALVTPALQARLTLRSLVLLMGGTAAVAFAAFGWVAQPLVIGLLLGIVAFCTAPANAVLLSAQIVRTPAVLQGRVMAASYLLAGLVAPLGPPTGGLLLDGFGPRTTFVCLGAATTLVTVAVGIARSMRD